jgi:uncharacterized protein (TIGR02145 family)
MNIHQSNGTVLQIPLNTIDSITYTIDNPSNLIEIYTEPFVNYPVGNPGYGGYIDTLAYVRSNITNIGVGVVTQRGVCWDVLPNPTIMNYSKINGSGTGPFNTSIGGLSPLTTYFVRAFALINNEILYGNQQSFTTCNNGPVLSNPGGGIAYNGYTYSSFILGNGQEWMGENLKTSFYSNGDAIPIDPNSSDLTIGASCHVGNDSQNDNIFGKLYNWYAVADTRNLCPVGWHVPSNYDWNVLSDYLGGWHVTGGKMKTQGTQYWQSPNNASNESGFSALPSGTGCFGDNMGILGFWWSSSDTGTNIAHHLDINYEGTYLGLNTEQKNNQKSLRCLRD